MNVVRVKENVLQLLLILHQMPLNCYLFFASSDEKNLSNQKKKTYTNQVFPLVIVLLLHIHIYIYIYGS